MADLSEYRTEPLIEPLEGGSEGATVRLRPLLAGEIRVTSGFSALPSGPLPGLRAGLGFLARVGAYWAPVPVFAIEHPTAGTILVDTGYDPSVNENPMNTMGPSARLLFAHRSYPVPERLGRLGLDDVRTVVFTHLHQDHSSGIGQFAGAQFVVTETELRAAVGRFSSIHPGGYWRPVLKPGYRWRTTRYDQGAPTPHGPFERSFDLLGDGSVRLVSTPGHSAGHQSVLVRLREREVLLTGDAIHLERQLREQRLMLIRQNTAAFRDSMSRIAAYARENPSALVIPGHDPEAWGRLHAVYT